VKSLKNENFTECADEDKIIMTSSFMLWFGCGRQQKLHVAAPPPAGVQRRMERNRQKLVGRDKGSLTE